MALESPRAAPAADGAGGTASIKLTAVQVVTCTFVNQRRASLTLNKVENGGLPLSRQWEFQLRQGASTSASGTVIATALANVTTGVVSFSGTFLPGAYNLCEVNMPVNTSNNIAGFTPDAEAAEGADNGNECINITPVSGANGPGGITGVPNPIDNIIFQGDARTIGYWRNWFSCTKGNQYTKVVERDEWDKTLDGNLPQMVGNLTLLGAPGVNQPLSAVNCWSAVNILSKRRPEWR